MSTHAVTGRAGDAAGLGARGRATADRQGNVFAVLDNGQTWTYLDASGPPQPGGEVTIRRASLGSYLLTTPSHHTFRAQRSQ